MEILKGNFMQNILEALIDYVMPPSLSEVKAAFPHKEGSDCSGQNFTFFVYEPTAGYGTFDGMMLDFNMGVLGCDECHAKALYRKG